MPLAPPATAPQPRAAAARSYLGLNSFLNLLNRWALGLYGLRFPLVMTASHMIFGACALMPMMMLNTSYRAKHQVVLRHDWRGISAIAVMNGFQIACNNASLTVMELSMNQVQRAALEIASADREIASAGREIASADREIASADREIAARGAHAHAAPSHAGDTRVDTPPRVTKATPPRVTKATLPRVIIGDTRVDTCPRRDPRDMHRVQSAE